MYVVTQTQKVSEEFLQAAVYIRDTNNLLFEMLQTIFPVKPRDIIVCHPPTSDNWQTKAKVVDLKSATEPLDLSDEPSAPKAAATPAAVASTSGKSSAEPVKPATPAAPSPAVAPVATTPPAAESKAPAPAATAAVTTKPTVATTTTPSAPVPAVESAAVPPRIDRSPSVHARPPPLPLSSAPSVPPPIPAEEETEPATVSLPPPGTYHPNPI